MFTSQRPPETDLQSDKVGLTAYYKGKGAPLFKYPNFYLGNEGWDRAKAEIGKEGASLLLAKEVDIQSLLWLRHYFSFGVCIQAESQSGLIFVSLHHSHRVTLCDVCAL